MQYEEMIGDGKNALGLYEQVPERQVLEGKVTDSDTTDKNGHVHSLSLDFVNKMYFNTSTLGCLPITYCCLCIIPVEFSSCHSG